MNYLLSFLIEKYSEISIIIIWVYILSQLYLARTYFVVVN